MMKGAPDTLSVLSGGGWHTLVLRYDAVVDIQRRTVGWVCWCEVVPDRRYPAVSLESVLGGLSRAELLRLLMWQFSRAREAQGEAEVRVLVQAASAALCVQSQPLRAQLSGGGLSLELVVGMPSEMMPYITLLSAICPVWLGGLGDGGATLKLAMSQPFSGVVVPPGVTRMLRDTEVGMLLLRAIVSFCAAGGRRAVVQGVDDEECLELLQDVQLWGVEGRIVGLSSQ